jgi:hypothetical protein
MGKEGPSYTAEGEPIYDTGPEGRRQYVTDSLSAVLALAGMAFYATVVFRRAVRFMMASQSR